MSADVHEVVAGPCLLLSVTITPAHRCMPTMISLSTPCYCAHQAFKCNQSVHPKHLQALLLALTVQKWFEYGIKSLGMILWSLQESSHGRRPDPWMLLNGIMQSVIGTSLQKQTERLRSSCPSCHAKSFACVLIWKSVSHKSSQPCCV